MNIVFILINSIVSLVFVIFSIGVLMDIGSFDMFVVDLVKHRNFIIILNLFSYLCTGAPGRVFLLAV